MARINVPGMGNQASLDALFLSYRVTLRELANEVCEFSWIGGIKLPCNCGQAKHKTPRESDGLGSLAFDPVRLIRGRIEVNGDFVAVLVTALIDQLLHLRAGLFGMR